MLNNMAEFSPDSTPPLGNPGFNQLLLAPHIPTLAVVELAFDQEEIVLASGVTADIEVTADHFGWRLSLVLSKPGANNQKLRIPQFKGLLPYSKGLLLSGKVKVDLLAGTDDDAVFMIVFEAEKEAFLTSTTFQIMDGYIFYLLDEDNPHNGFDPDSEIEEFDV